MSSDYIMCSLRELIYELRIYYECTNSEIRNGIRYSLISETELSASAYSLYGFQTSDIGFQISDSFSFISDIWFLTPDI